MEPHLYLGNAIVISSYRSFLEFVFFMESNSCEYKQQHSLSLGFNMQLALA